LLLAGCNGGNLSWRKVTNSPAPSHFTWRNSNELWGDGDAVARRKNGAWEALDVCGPYLKSKGAAVNRASVTVGFASDGSVFALCGGNLADGQDLVHFDAGGAGVTLPLPNDGAMALVQLLGDIALVGASRFFKREGGKFTELTAHPFAGPPQAAGLWLQEIYASGATSMWWNGKTWAEVALPLAENGNKLAHPPELRNGTVTLGPSRVQAGIVLPLVTDNPGLKRPVRFAGALPPDAALFVGTPPVGAEESSKVAHFWIGRSGEDDLEYLGNGAFGSGSMYTIGGFGGYPIDEATLLVTSIHGAIGGKISSELWEGGL